MSFPVYVAYYSSSSLTHIHVDIALVVNGSSTFVLSEIPAACLAFWNPRQWKNSEKGAMSVIGEQSDRY